MKLTTILLGCHLTGCLLAADLKIENELPLVSSRHTNTVKLSPGPDDAQIARLAARIMERSHYSQQPLDETVSSKFFDRYFDALDPARLLFLLSDIAEFERWRPKLGELTVKLGDTSPAEMIFNRFMERYDQHIIFMTNQVATGKFEFTGDDRYVLNRKELSRPKDLNEAKKCGSSGSATNTSRRSSTRKSRRRSSRSSPAVTTASCGCCATSTVTRSSRFT